MIATGEEQYNGICAVRNNYFYFKFLHIKGDSGGPLEIHNITDNRIYLMGIHSFGDICSLEQIHFYSSYVKNFLDVICNVTGVCE